MKWEIQKVVVLDVVDVGKKSKIVTVYEARVNSNVKFAPV